MEIHSNIETYLQQQREQQQRYWVHHKDIPLVGTTCFPLFQVQQIGTSLGTTYLLPFIKKVSRYYRRRRAVVSTCQVLCCCACTLCVCCMGCYCCEAVNCRYVGGTYLGTYTTYLPTQVLTQNSSSIIPQPHSSVSVPTAYLPTYLPTQKPTFLPSWCRWSGVKHAQNFPPFPEAERSNTLWVVGS